MTREEALILGVGSAAEAASLRDVAMKLLGAFEQHVEAESKWQDRMEQKLDDMPSLMDSKIEDCSARAKPYVDTAVHHAEEEVITQAYRARVARVLVGVIGVTAGVAGIVFGMMEHFFR